MVELRVTEMGTSFPERLRELRKEKGWSQDYLGSLINVSDATINRYESTDETKYRQPDLETTSHLADIFGVSVDYLVGRSNIRDRITVSGHSEWVYTKEDEEAGLPPDWVEHLNLLFRVGKKLTPEQRKAIMSAGRAFAIEVEEEERKKKE